MSLIGQTLDTGISTNLSEIEVMKERFAKILLGEDMSGEGNGVSTALAISNSIANLSAAVFGKLLKLEPLSSQNKSTWCREMDWILSVSNAIVELIPSSSQEFQGSSVINPTYEVMMAQPRLDLHINLPALKKLDTMLLNLLDDFKCSEFHYIDSDEAEHLHDTYSSSQLARGSISSDKGSVLPFPKVGSNGLSDDVRKKLQDSRQCASQIHKAATTVNSHVLSEMEIPNVYFRNLPKNGKDCLGEIIYQCITTDHFSPEHAIDHLNLSSQYTILEIANRTEAAMHVWRQKRLVRHASNGGRSTWIGKVKCLVGETYNAEVLAQRAETLLQHLKLRVPDLPQTALDTNRILYNKDVGKAILEAYSSVIKNLASKTIERIDDLFYIDDATKHRVVTIDHQQQHLSFSSPINFAVRRAISDLPSP